MTDVPTTALQLVDIAPDPSALTTGASPTTITIGERLYRITTGGTGGPESIVIPLPDLPVDGWVNDSLLGLRITFCIETQTDPSDKVVITLAGRSIQTAAPPAFQLPFAQSVSLSFVGAIASFVWSADTWMVDSAYADSNFDYNFTNGAAAYLAPQGQAANGRGIVTGMVASSAASGSNQQGGDVLLEPGAGDGAGRAGLVINLGGWPTEDPHVVNALWNNSGVLTVSAG